MPTGKVEAPRGARTAQRNMFCAARCEERLIYRLGLYVQTRQGPVHVGCYDQHKDEYRSELTEARRALEWDTVACPACGAGAGSRCQEDGLERLANHAERRRAYYAAKAGNGGRVSPATEESLANLRKVRDARQALPFAPEAPSKRAVRSPWRNRSPL